MALVPTIIRACSMTSNICAMPLWTSPTSQPLAGTPCWPSDSSQVAETFRPILCSTLVTKTPLRSPELAGLEVEEELRHEEQRQTLGARSGALGAGQHQVEDVLEQVVGVTGGDEALHAVDVPGAVLLLDGLGAAGADVGTGVGLGEHHGRGPSRARRPARPTSSAPRCRGCRRSARSRRPSRTCTTAGLAPRMCSIRAHCSAVGIGMPPSSSSRPILSQPPSRMARTDFLNDSGSVTECVLGSNTGGLRSPSANDSAIGPSASRAISPSISRGGVGVQVGVLRPRRAPCPRRTPRTG